MNSVLNGIKNMKSKSIEKEGQIETPKKVK